MPNAWYVHFQPEEHPFVDKAVDWGERSVRHHDVKRTDFLDPRQAWILTTVAGRYPDVRLHLDGGYPQAERKRALIMPAYRSPEEMDAGIRVLELTSPDAKFAELEHGDVLGSLTGLGVRRDKLGDIHLHRNFCHCLVAEEMSEFISLHLYQVGRVRVFVETVPLEKLRPVKVRLNEMQLFVTSLRLDGILSDVCRVSRAKVIAPIKAGHCRVNWKVETDPSAQLRSGDVVSLTGFGRFKILESEGVSKSGRVRLRVGKFS